MKIFVLLKKLRQKVPVRFQQWYDQLIVVQVILMLNQNIKKAVVRKSYDVLVQPVYQHLNFVVVVVQQHTQVADRAARP